MRDPSCVFRNPPAHRPPGHGSAARAAVRWEEKRKSRSPGGAGRRLAHLEEVEQHPPSTVVSESMALARQDDLDRWGSVLTTFWGIVPSLSSHYSISMHPIRYLIQGSQLPTRCVMDFGVSPVLSRHPKRPSLAFA